MEIDWINFTPFASFLGGIILGLASALMLILFGRIMGISGIIGTALERPKHDTLWRVVFLAGLASAAVIFAPLVDTSRTVPMTSSLWLIALAGLLVGYGTRLGSGCTSGHGICGISRLSVRSIVATGVFMVTGIITVAVMQFVF
jgi:uncharacterized membrane protein YedE/YeeE